MSNRNALIALAKLHITQHYRENSWVFTDPETFAYYKSFAQNHQAPIPQKPAPQAKPILTPRKAPLPPPKTVPPAPAPPPKAPPPAAIEREKPKPADTIDVSDFKGIFAKCFPAQKILEHPPDDAAAKEQAQRWQKKCASPEILILDTSQTAEEKHFLHNVALALESRFYPTAVVHPDQWDKAHQLRLVVGPSSAFNEKEPFRTVVMEPINTYLQQPKMKAKLWQDLKNTLQ